MIKVEKLKFGYKDKIILNDINVNIPQGKITIIIGNNGCGKSTLLKSMCNIINPISGEIYFNDKEIKEIGIKGIAKLVSVVHQTPKVPEEVTIEELCYMGRNPHKGIFDRINKKDKEIVEKAIKMTGLWELKDRNLINLSGGQRQRAFIALALAQDTEIIFLDEPTTYLDINYQYEILDLLKELNDNFNKTIVMVHHDLNQAATYADNIILMSEGKVLNQGTPEKVITEDSIEKVFKLKCEKICSSRGQCCFVPVERIV
ncbi:MAG: ABC transporter ATP-binding protein [Peptostreptococcaceae bacterium]